METKLVRIAELAKTQPNTKFTSLAHLLNEDALKRCHHELPNNCLVHNKSREYCNQKHRSCRQKSLNY